MRLSTPILATSLNATASAAVFEVLVGEGGNKFQPSTITAQVGDSVSFKFNNVLHDVAQSSANAPCQYNSPNGFYSTQVSTNTAQFTINITNTEPKYFFCSVANHCNAGMVGIINPGNVTQSDFSRNARSAEVSAPRNSAHIGGILSTGGTAAVSGSSLVSSPSGTAATASPTSTGGASRRGIGAPVAALVVAGALAAYL